MTPRLPRALRYRQPRPVCTCAWHFAPGLDMVRTHAPDCPIPDHRAKARPPR